MMRLGNFLQRGFTLFELMIVMMIMAILVSIAVPTYKRSQIKARETVLLEDLFQIRKAIDSFFADSERYPAELSELVQGKYIRILPRDPFTGNAKSWVCVPPESDLNGSLQQGECFDVHSSSDLVGLNGVAYKLW